LKNWLENDITTKFKCNIALVPNPTNIIPGDMGVLFSQLEAFFQLYHTINFDFIIPLSTLHYPMKSSQDIIIELEVRLINY
jgi:hypothetical protein